MKDEILIERKVSKLKKKKNLDLLLGLNNSLSSVELFMEGKA